MCIAAILILLTDRNKHRASLSAEGDHKVEDDADANLRKQLSADPIGTSLDPSSSDTTTSSVRKKRPSWIPGTSFFKETGLVQESSGYQEQGPSHQMSEKEVASTEERKMSTTNPDAVNAVPGANSPPHPADKIIPIVQFLKQVKDNPVAEQEGHRITEEDQENKVHVDNQELKLDQIPDLINDKAAVTPKKKKKGILKLSKGKKAATSKKSDQSKTYTNSENVVTESSSEPPKVNQYNEGQEKSTNQHETKNDSGDDKFGVETEVFVKETSKDSVPEESGMNNLQEQNQNTNQTESNTIKTNINEETHSQQQHKVPKLTTPNQKTRPFRRVFEQGTIDKGGKKFLARIESSSVEENPEAKLDKNSQKVIVGGNPGVKSENNSPTEILDEKPAVKAANNPGKETLQGISSVQVETPSNQESTHGSDIVKDKLPSVEEALDHTINTLKEMSPKQDTIIEHLTAKEQISDKEENIQTKNSMQGDRSDLKIQSKNHNQEGLYEFPRIASKDEHSPDKSVDKPNDNHHIVTQLGEAQ